MGINIGDLVVSKASYSKGRVGKVTEFYSVDDIKCVRLDFIDSNKGYRWHKLDDLIILSSVNTSKQLELQVVANKELIKIIEEVKKENESLKQDLHNHKVSEDQLLIENHKHYMEIKDLKKENESLRIHLAIQLVKANFKSNK